MEQLEKFRKEWIKNIEESKTNVKSTSNSTKLDEFERKNPKSNYIDQTLTIDNIYDSIGKRQKLEPVSHSKDSKEKEKEKESQKFAPRQISFKKNGELVVQNNKDEKKTIVFSQDEKSERLLDTLLKDLEEINEIPFFDTSLPLEVVIRIFGYLSLKDISTCKLVSKSWKRAAEDELLWKRISFLHGWFSLKTGYHSWKESFEQLFRDFWNLKKRWLERVCKSHSLVGRSLNNRITLFANCFATNNQYIFAGFVDGNVRGWRMDNINQFYFFGNIQEEPDTQTTFLQAEENLLYYTLNDNFTKCVHIETGEMVYEIYTEDAINKVHSFSPETTFCSTKKEILSIEYQSDKNFWQVNKKINLNRESDLCCEFLQDKDTCVAVSREMEGQVTFKLWDVLSSSLLYEYVSLEEPLSLEINPDVIVSLMSSRSGFQRAISIISTKTSTLVEKLESKTNRCSCFNFKDSPPFLIAAGNLSGSASVYDIRTSKEEIKFINAGTYDSVKIVQMDSYKLISGRDNGNCFVYDIRKATTCWNTHLNKTKLKHMKFDKDRLVCCGSTKHHNDMTNWYQPEDRSTIHFYDFSEGSNVSKVQKEFTSTFAEPQPVSLTQVQLALPYQ